MSAIVTKNGRVGYFGNSAAGNLAKRFGEIPRITVKYQPVSGDDWRYRSIELSEAFLKVARSISRQPKLEIEDLFSKDIRGTQ